MQVHYDIEQLPFFKNTIITIGTFDGVHCGHQQIIKLLLHEAKKNNKESVVITFHPHPKMIVDNATHPIKILNTLPEKILMLQKQGLHHLVIVPFTQKFAHQSADDYLNNFLVKKFHPHTIIIGYDHKFGADRKGDYKLLETHATVNNYLVKEIPQQILHNVAISSTKIRAALLHGDIKTANEFLGYRYFFSGIVVAGKKLGRTLGYPTANLFIEDENKLIPGHGVYAVDVDIAYTSGEVKKMTGMMNIGLRPTIDGTLRTIEVNIFNFDDDIYGRSLTIYFKQKIRDEIKFNSLDELKIQLAKDKEQAFKSDIG